MAWPSIPPSPSHVSSALYEYNQINLNHAWSPYKKQVNDHFSASQEVDNLARNPPLSTTAYLAYPFSEFNPPFPMLSSPPEPDITASNFSINQQDTGIFEAQGIPPQSFTSLWRPQVPSSRPTSIPSSLTQHRDWNEEMGTTSKVPAPCCHGCKPISKQGTFTCGWKNCENPGPFTRKAVLMRHIDTQHISPRGFGCPFELCGKTFNRKDNLDEHLRRVHSKFDGLRASQLQVGGMGLRRL